MKIKNIIAVLLCSVCMTFPTITASPETVTAYDYSYETFGLIEKCSISCTESNGALKIVAKTQSSRNMEKIGFIDIIIQKSSDKRNWTNEKSLGDFIESDKKYYTLNITENITGGFFYRVICTHYAKGKPFKSDNTESQKADNSSKIIWVSPLPAPTVIPDNTTTTTATTNTTTSTVTTTYTTTPTSSLTTQSRTPTTTTTNTTTSTTISTYTDNAPKTGVKIPFAIFLTSAISTIVAIITRKKHE